MAVTTRIVNGKTQIWDDEAMDWREIGEPIMKVHDAWFSSLTLVSAPKKERKKPFVCGKCGGAVERTTYFTGWEVEDIHPETGEDWGVQDEGKNDITEIEYTCKNAICTWSAGPSWTENINHEQQQLIAFDIEGPEEPIQQEVKETPFNPTPVQLELWERFQKGEPKFPFFELYDG